MSTPPSEQNIARWFEQEVQPHEQPLRSFLHQSLNSKADVDDLMQDTYARLVRTKSRGEIRSTKPLLFAIARNALRDFIRRRRTAKLESIDEPTAEPLATPGDTVVESVCRSQEAKILSDGILTLPDRCREVFLLRRIKGMPQREVAQALGISEKTVEVHIATATQRLAAYLRARGVNGGRA